MHRFRVRAAYAFFLSVILLAPSSFAFESPLSDTAVREAYFLGQRHDETLSSFFSSYAQHPPPPKTGPYISSVAFFTPFAQLVQLSGSYSGNYSAQQAELDHRGQAEFVKIVVEIQLTSSYGSLIPGPSNSSSSPDLIKRPSDFWRDFQVQVFNGNQQLSPSSFQGKPNYNCGRHGPCFLTGATIELDLPADAFTSDSASVLVTPPEGAQVSASFDLQRLR
jgi:hypothetical protein